ncbi:hypothetical protein C2845_PM03G35560 [Panicum miliaceum]|uniref:Uncharacterized protein n=1 Tax=Panicum miliaceum TaxID=4540 RepID=A0A3L6T941_PANMI|nr:hypothetical protein C2845_PM03G35560 [Panicum miliaceum]
MGLLDQLWDDTVAGPRPDSGLGKLRKYASFSPSSSSSVSAAAAASPPAEGAAGAAPPVTRSISMLRPSALSVVTSPRSESSSAPSSPASGAPDSPFGAATTPKGEGWNWKKLRRKGRMAADGADAPGMPRSPTVYDCSPSLEVKAGDASSGDLTRLLVMSMYVAESYVPVAGDDDKVRCAHRCSPCRALRGAGRPVQAAMHGWMDGPGESGRCSVAVVLPSGVLARSLPIGSYASHIKANPHPRIKPDDLISQINRVDSNIDQCIKIVEDALQGQDPPASTTSYDPAPPSYHHSPPTDIFDGIDCVGKGIGSSIKLGVPTNRAARHIKRVAEKAHRVRRDSGEDPQPLDLARRRPYKKSSFFGESTLCRRLVGPFMETVAPHTQDDQPMRPNEHHRGRNGKLLQDPWWSALSTSGKRGAGRSGVGVWE